MDEARALLEGWPGPSASTIGSGSRPCWSWRRPDETRCGFRAVEHGPDGGACTRGRGARVERGGAGVDDRRSVHSSPDRLHRCACRRNRHRRVGGSCCATGGFRTPWRRRCIGRGTGIGAGGSPGDRQRCRFGELDRRSARALRFGRSDGGLGDRDGRTGGGGRGPVGHRGIRRHHRRRRRRLRRCRPHQGADSGLRQGQARPPWSDAYPAEILAAESDY